MNDCALTLSVSKTEDSDPPSVTVWYGNGEYDRIRIAFASPMPRHVGASRGRARGSTQKPRPFFFTALAERELFRQCTGRAEAPTTPFREAYLICGRAACPQELRACAYCRSSLPAFAVMRTV
jgi:hypothetical protein